MQPERTMKKTGNREFLFEVISLIVIAILVHAVYSIHVRPRAAAIRAHDAARMKVDPDYVPERFIEVIVKDPEQEVCFVLALWAFAIMGYKALALRRGRKLLETDLLRLPEGMKILPEDSRDYARQVEALPQEMRGELLPRALLSGLHRFGSTRNIQDVSSAIHDTCELEFGRLDAELSMVRYVAWAIPAIGFVGTVRGIGESLQQAHKAVEGDVSGVVAGLGISFNSTLVALALSILVMFLLHQVQLRQERAVLDTEEFLDTHVVRQMLVR
jgi:biopolymer transport protein ExbB/TolQ